MGSPSFSKMQRGNRYVAVQGRDQALARRMDSYLEEMLAAGLIQSGYTILNAPIFPIWKDQSKGSIRPVYHCRQLNRDLRTQTFSLSDIRTFIMMREKGDLYAKIYLTNTFWHFSMRKCHSKYLIIRWRSQLYRWAVLPFGLSTAPYTFQRALKGVDRYISQVLASDIFDIWMICSFAGLRII